MVGLNRPDTYQPPQRVPPLEYKTRSCPQSFRLSAIACDLKLCIGGSEGCAIHYVSYLLGSALYPDRLCEGRRDALRCAVRVDLVIWQPPQLGLLPHHRVKRARASERTSRTT
jgi:hypothetical protein